MLFYLILFSALVRHYIAFALNALLYDDMTQRNTRSMSFADRSSVITCTAMLGMSGNVSIPSESWMTEIFLKQVTISRVWSSKAASRQFTS